MKKKPSYKTLVKIGTFRQRHLHPEKRTKPRGDRGRNGAWPLHRAVVADAHKPVGRLQTRRLLEGELFPAERRHDIEGVSRGVRCHYPVTIFAFFSGLWWFFSFNVLNYRFCILTVILAKNIQKIKIFFRKNSEFNKKERPKSQPTHSDRPF